MKILKILGILVLVVVVLVVGALAWAFHTANARYTKTWTAHDATFPIPFPLDTAEVAALALEKKSAGASAKDPLDGVDLAAVANARAVARGEHLAETRLGCVGCHGKDYGGGIIVDVAPVGYWAAPNLTSGPGSVTNGFSAHDWDLAVRHGIRHTGQSSSMPCKDFTNLSDRELSDIIAYIKTRPPVDRLMKPVRLGPVFAVMTATDPNALPAYVIDHQKPHAVEPPPEAVTLEFGEHVSTTCRGCHNPKFSGGKMAGDPNMPIVANLTPDASGLKTWTETDFVRAMHEGKRPDGSAIATAMPWQMYGKMNDTELKAIWLYLQSLPPTPKGTH